MSPSDDLLNINTPENVAFDYQIAGIGSRFLAALIDTLWLGLLQVITYATLFMFVISAVDSEELLDSGITVWLIALLGLVGFIFLWGYYIAFELAWNGQTPGKRRCGLRVIRMDGTPVTLTEVLIRNLVRAIDFLPMFYGIGIVVMFINKESRRLGDLAAGTLVVFDRPVNLQLATEPERYRPLFQAPAELDLSTLPVERLTAQDLELAEEFLRRRAQLVNSEQLAAQVLYSLRQRMGLPSEALSPLKADDQIFAILKAYRERQKRGER